MLDDPAVVQEGLKALPVDQLFHLYVNIGMPQMTNSVCKHAILLLPVEWHAQLAQDHPYRVALKTFFNVFLVPLSPAEAQPYADVFTGWRHATMCAAAAGTWAHFICKKNPPN